MNPMREWLDLDIDRPNHYQLLKLKEYERDSAKISSAADRAMSRVRSQRPGQYAALWMDLLDRLAAAKRCLTDPQLKAAYDRALRSGELDCEALAPSAADFVADENDQEPLPPAAKTSNALLDDTEGNVSPPLAHQPDNPPEPLPSSVESGDHPDEPLDNAPVPPTPTPTQLADPPLVSPGWDPADVLPQAHDLAADSLHPPVPDGQAVFFATSSSSATDAVSPAEIVIRQGETRGGKGVLLPIVVGVCAGLLILAVYGVARYSSSSSPRKAEENDRPDHNVSSVERRAESDASSASLSQESPSRSNPAQHPANDLAHNAVRESTPVKSPFDGSGNPTADSLFNSAAGSLPASEPPKTLGLGRTDPPPAGTMPSPDPGKPGLALQRALVTIRAAFATRDFATAQNRLAEIRRQEGLNQHLAAVERLERVGELVKEFYATVDRAIAKLAAGSEIKISPTTVVAVVEVSADHLILRVRGMNRRYELAALSPGLAMGLAAAELGEANPRLRLLKAAYLAVRESTTASQRARAREWLEEVSDQFPAAREVLRNLDENHQQVDGV